MHRALFGSLVSPANATKTPVASADRCEHLFTVRTHLDMLCAAAPPHCFFGRKDPRQGRWQRNLCLSVSAMCGFLCWGNMEERALLLMALAFLPTAGLCQEIDGLPKVV